MCPHGTEQTSRERKKADARAKAVLSMRSGAMRARALFLQRVPALGERKGRETKRVWRKERRREGEKQQRNASQEILYYKEILSLGRSLDDFRAQ
jgi:hypothetical protein